MERLVRYFTEGIEGNPIGDTIGMEVETSFIDIKTSKPITVEQSQQLFINFCHRYENNWCAWKVTQRKGNLITEISDGGDRFLYELGRQNIELSTASYPGSGPTLTAISAAESLMKNMVMIAAEIGIVPNLKPILETNEELLVIPDERDATWLELDGRPALELLARTSAVQFTISVPLSRAIECLNRLGERTGSFLKGYPQEENWRRYIKESKANYHALRYGGPLFFDSIKDYCKQLIKHDVVVGPNLLSYYQVQDLDIPLYLRSIWWYFRLRRYGNTLCIEVRPLPRRSHIKFQEQFDFVMGILSPKTVSLPKIPFVFEEGGAFTEGDKE